MSGGNAAAQEAGRKDTAIWQVEFAAPRYWPTWIVLAALRLTVLLPYAGRLLAGRVLGLALLAVMGRRRRIARTNLRLCLPELDTHARRRHLVEHFQALGIAFVEMGAAWWLPDRRLRGLATVVGLEHLERALAAGRGAILLSAHFTSMEMGLRLFSMVRPCHMIYRPNKNRLLDRVITRGRSRHPGHMFRRDEVRTMLAALRRNEPVWYPPDQDHGIGQGVFAPFFGRPAATIVATSRFARLARAPVIPFYHYRLPGLRGYELRLLPALEDFPGEDDAADARRTNAILEREVREHVSQYLWAHRRFKTCPPGEPYPYDD